jgi:hypothetical protein
MAGTKKGAAKGVATIKQKYGEDYYSKIGKHNNRPNRDKPEWMSEIGKLGAQKRWAKVRENEKEKDTSTQ